MTIASFCRDQLLTCGPLALDVLATRAAAAGVTTARDPAAAVRSAIAYTDVPLADGRWATPLWLLEGRILTARRLPLIADGSAPSFDDEADEPDPYLSLPDNACHDLAPLDRAVRASHVPLPAGGVLRGDRYNGSWRAPRGWPGVQPARGELLGLRVRDGTLHVELVPMTQELQRAGERLAHELGPLDARGRSWTPHAAQVAENLATALWERMAAEPTFLTMPVPPLSECLPPLAVALRLESEQRAERARRWRPQLDLPAHLQAVAVVGAGRSGQLLDEWLDGHVERSLRSLGDDLLPADEEYGQVVELRRPQWSG